MADETKCPIWGTPAEFEPKTGDFSRLTSPRAGGRYSIDGSIEVVIANRDVVFKARLTSWLVDQHRYGVECPGITRDILDEVERRTILAVHERADRLLEYLSKVTPRIGEAVDFFPCSQPADSTTYEILAWTESIKSSEMLFLIGYLDKLGWIDGSHSSKDGPSLVVTVDGYQRLADLATKNINAKQAFIAMWFDPSMQEARQAIKDGIRDAGFDPQVVNEIPHNNKICDRIIAEIRRSRFLVADFTSDFDLSPDKVGLLKPENKGARGGVYYEAGFAHGLNIPVIFTCRKDVIEKVHFDTRQYNHITWETPDDLRKQLADRISATIGDGPLRNQTQTAGGQ